jgi:hypothetical protein
MQSVAGKTFGTVSADRQREMSGLEFVRGLIEEHYLSTRSLRP